MTNLLVTLKQVLKGGHVTRYHTRPEVSDNQTVADHTWRALIILTTLWPSVKKEALLSLLLHDVAEAELGDVPATAKWNYKNLAEEYARAEADYTKKMAINFPALDLEQHNRSLTPEEKRCIKMSDMLELVLHCKRQMQKGNTLAEEIYERGIDYLEENFSSYPEYSPVKDVLATLRSSTDHSFIERENNMAYKLSQRSLDRLQGVDNSLVEVVKKAIEITEIDFGVICGLRTMEEQEALVAKGASQTMKSKHLEGLAVDLMAYVDGRGCWELNVYDEIADAMKQAAIDLDTQVRWGAAWNIPDIRDWEGSMEEGMNHYIDERRSQDRRPFIDAPHFELMK